MSWFILTIVLFLALRATAAPVRSNAIGSRHISDSDSTALAPGTPDVHPRFGPFRFGGHGFGGFKNFHPGENAVSNM
ncbi:hypothetical protein QCA50_016117 [Cerrena zonata]|uniref:Secreted protein n=1 Tax=Cerrena zonata TaxID=2478898 RepID=A0AAW0FND6_9APHY